MTEVSQCQVCRSDLPEAVTRPFRYCSKACRRLANYEIERINKRLLRLDVHLDGLREKLLVEDLDKPRRPNYIARHLTRQMAAAEQVRNDTELRLLALLQSNES